MTNSTHKITLVTVCDNIYAILLGTLIKSIELTHTSSELIELYIVDDQISGKNKKRINDCVTDPARLTLKWIKLKDTFSYNIPLPRDSSTFPVNVYSRLMIPYFLPAEVTKAIYLDVDMILERDIADLWNIDIGDHPVAGVPDRCELVSHSPWGIQNYKELGIPADTKYFNSGLLIFNLPLWRKHNYTAMITACVEENKKYAGFPDQYGLNVIFANKWYELDARWNTFSSSREKNPFLIHFIGSKPIFSNYMFNKEYKKRFYHYLSYTPWKNFKQHGKLRWKANKLLNKLKNYGFIKKMGI